jgi:hypothetical protein
MQAHRQHRLMRVLLGALLALSLSGLWASMACASSWPRGLPEPGVSPGQVSKEPPAFSSELATFPATSSPVTSSGSSGVTPDSGFEENEGGGQWTCNSIWNTIANYASGVLIGNCSYGSILNRTWYSSANSEGIKFSGGYISGSYNYCGWLETGQITYKDGNHYSACSPPNTAYGKIGYAYNSKSMHGPTATTTQHVGCQLYANVHPWEGTPEVTDLLTPTPLPVGSPLSWRYIVGYGPNQPHKDGKYHDYWVAVYDPYGYGGASWAYAPFYGCFQQSDGEVYLPPGEGGYWFPEA